MRHPAGCNDSKRLTSCSIAEHVACDIQVLPHDQSLDGTEIKRLQRIVNTKAVLVRVLADFIEVLLDKPLLLYELHICQCIRCKLDGLRTDCVNYNNNPKTFKPTWLKPFSPP